MPSTAPTRAAIYVKEAASYPDGENSKELQFKQKNVKSSALPKGSRSAPATTTLREADTNSTG